MSYYSPRVTINQINPGDKYSKIKTYLVDLRHDFNKALAQLTHEELSRRLLIEAYHDGDVALDAAKEEFRKLALSLGEEILSLKVFANVEDALLAQKAFKIFVDIETALYSQILKRVVLQVQNNDDVKLVSALADQSKDSQILSRVLVCLFYIQHKLFADTIPVNAPLGTWTRTLNRTLPSDILDSGQDNLFAKVLQTPVLTDPTFDKVIAQPDHHGTDGLTSRVFVPYATSYVFENVTESFQVQATQAELVLDDPNVVIFGVQCFPSVYQAPPPR